MTDTRSVSMQASSAVPPATALLLLGLLLFRTITLLLGSGVILGILHAIDPATTLRDATLYSNVLIVAVDLVTLLVLASVLRREGRTLRSLFDRIRASDISWGLLLFSILLVGFLFATFIGNLIVYQGAPPIPTSRVSIPLWLATWSILVTPVTVAIAEESLYRGYLQPRLMARLGLWGGLLVTAGFFGLQHLALSPASPQSMATRVLTTALVGVLLGAMYLWRKRLLQLVIAHWLLDVVGLGLPLLLLAL